MLTGGPLRPAGLISERRFKPSLGAMWSPRSCSAPR